MSQAVVCCQGVAVLGGEEGLVRAAESHESLGCRREGGDCPELPEFIGEW